MSEKWKSEEGSSAADFVTDLTDVNPMEVGRRQKEKGRRKKAEGRRKKE
ncbi:hypothetical protein QT971_04910 [Microcoleus sp. herbarium19]